MLLVTGGTGFLGRNFLEQTQEPCYFTGRNLAKGMRVAHETRHRFLPIDLATEDLTGLKGITGIVHCAAKSSPWGAYDEFFEHNVLATRRLLEFAKTNAVSRFVHISTPSLYFDFQDRQGVREDHRAATFANHYAHTKYLAELEVANYAGDMHVTVLRPRGIFGKHDTTIIPRIIELGDGRGIPLARDGNAVVDMTHVDNVVHAIKLALNGEHRSGEVYNITNGEPMRVIDLIDRLSYCLKREMKVRKLPGALVGTIASVLQAWGTLVGKEPSLTRYTAALLRYDQTLDILKAQHQLGYQPVKSIVDGLKDYCHK